MATIHIPVLLKEVLDLLNPQPNQNFIDCTLGGGGHALEILKKTSANGKLLAFDADPEPIKNFFIKATAAGIDHNRFQLINSNFYNIEYYYEQYFSLPVDGVLFDLGLSSDQLRDETRGFSFNALGPLDMRFDKKNSQTTAADILNTYSLEQLINIFKNLGEEPHARRVAQAIIKARRRERIITVSQLVEIIRDITGSRRRLHPATLVFQALRLAVNQELDNLKKALPEAVKILKAGGRLVVISFHSLEDRIVKNYFRDLQRNNLIKILTKKPLVPGCDELKINPASRSAKLRAVEKL